MDVVEFKRRMRNQPHEDLYPLQNLELLPGNKRIKRQVIDPRSFKVDGRWQVYPIAVTRKQVYIVCPWCKGIHVHGGSADDCAGGRTSHCDVKPYENDGYDILELKKAEATQQGQGKEKVQ